MGGIFFSSRGIINTNFQIVPSGRTKGDLMGEGACRKHNGTDDILAFMLARTLNVFLLLLYFIASR